jgi:phosphoserine phosphatase RsbU/P
MEKTYSILLAGLGSSDESLVSAHFSGLGHAVLTAKGPGEARELLKDKKADLYFFQAAADDGGVSEIERITQQGSLAPVVFICPRQTESFILKAWHAGAADILVLPLSVGSLDASLQRCINWIQARERDRATPIQARFVFLDESGKECMARITAPQFAIGRNAGNDLILGQRGISRAHANVTVQNGEYFLQDLDSKQGTYLNDVRVNRARLINGDRVQLGGPQGVNLIFRTGDLLQSLLAVADSKSEINLSVHGFKEVGMLFAAFRALSSIPVLDDLLALVVDTAIELAGAERGFIMLKEENGELSFRCARNNMKRTLDGSCFQTSHRVPYEAFKTGRAVVIKDLDFGDLSESHAATRRLGLRSISCVPLRYFAVHDPGEQTLTEDVVTIGVLYVDSSTVSAGFSNLRIDALETLASEAAMAIYNARLYKDSQDKRRLDEQLSVAREIQQALLPRPDRDLPYAHAFSQNLPCYEVGGDYFDYFNLEGGRFGFALGDVAGKGMAAALLASLVQGVLSAQTQFETPLPSMMSNINRILAQRGTGNRFVTFFFGILDPDGNCSYVNAGHNPPFVLSQDGSMVELTAGGMVLGLFPGAEYEAGGARLQPGDHLVLFTDGVVEALNTEGEEFGQERLAALLRAKARDNTREILTSLREAVLSFSANAPQHDDITLMVVGFRESL